MNKKELVAVASEITDLFIREKMDQVQIFKVIIALSAACVADVAKESNTDPKEVLQWLVTAMADVVNPRGAIGSPRGSGVRRTDS